MTKKASWTGTNVDWPIKLPISVIYLNDFLPISNDEQMELIHKFIKDTEQTFGIETRRMSIADTWKANPPPDAKGESVQDYLADVRERAKFVVLLILKYLRSESIPSSTTSTIPWMHFDRNTKPSSVVTPT